MNLSRDLSRKSFAIYGLGSTGRSVIKYFNRNRFKNYVIWDDDKDLRRTWNLNKKKEEDFINSLNLVDHIIVSPGVDLKKVKYKKILLRNKDKIITDLDLFYILNPKIKSIVVTGTNGKSTTCKIIDHLLKKNKIHSVLGGNIGKPILSLNLKKNPLVIIEASSFQLSYSKFVKPNYALILNITNDHLDWHGSMKKYIEAKFKIFSIQKKDDYAFINDKKLLSIYKIKKYAGKINFVRSKNFKKVKYKINNHHLNYQANEENLSFVFALSKVLKITEKSFVKSLISFKGLPHRYEILFRKKNTVYINDSKATSFQASSFALKSNENIFWIVGGMPKTGDKIILKNLKNKIIKAYIIGNYMGNFKKQLTGKVDFQLSKTLNNAIDSIFKEIKNNKSKKTTVLLSPAAASYDQFKNFEERGNQFKKLIKNYDRKYF